MLHWDIKEIKYQFIWSINEYLFSVSCKEEFKLYSNLATILCIYTIHLNIILDKEGIQCLFHFYYSRSIVSRGVL